MVNIFIDLLKEGFVLIVFDDHLNRLLTMKFHWLGGHVDSRRFTVVIY